MPELGLSDVRFVFPAAPSLPVTINGGMVMPAWYDILSFDDPPMREEASSVRTSAGHVEALIKSEQARGVPSNRIVLMGFSQGGAMALHVGTRYKEPLAGICALSGYLLMPEQLPLERNSANLETPILFCHGDADPVVTPRLGDHAYRTVQALGYNTEFRTFPMPHSICMPEVQVVGSWLRRVLNP